jgi:hypothetical protein
VQKRWWSGLAAAVVVVGFAVACRHALIRFGLDQAIGIATGYTVRIGDQRLGRDHGAFLDVHVSRNGEPVLDATRIDLYYSLRDLLPGSTHRFGLTGIAIASPVFTALRHRDGTYNIILPSGSTASSGPPGRPNGVPFRFTVRVRDGSAVLVDQAEYARDHTRQRVLHIAADATVDSSARTHYVASGDLEDVKPEPFRAVGTVDLLRGYAIHHLQAKAIPIRTIGNFIMNSPALKILAGTAHHVDAKVYSLDVAPNVPIAYHVGASLDVADGQLYVASLARPLDRIDGRLQIVDDQFFSKRLDATLAGVPVLVAGGLFDFAAPQLRFGLSGRGDLAKLRGVLAFARAQPVRGDARIGVLIEGATADPVVVAHADAPRAYYRDLPLDAVHADVALAHGVVYVAPLLADYAGVRTIARGSLTLGKPVASLLAIHADASSDDLPYVAELLPHEPMVADAILGGSDVALEARGSLASARDVAHASALFSFAPNGVAEVAPFHIASGAGSVTGRYHLDRPGGTSAFWAIAQNVDLHAPARTLFPGARLPQLPPISGTLGYAAVVGGGSGANIVLAGRLSATRVTVANVPFDLVAATFGGNLADAAISRAHADGPWGSFDGAGAFSPGGIAARGSYSGTLQGLRPYLGGIAGSGAVSGPVALSVEPNRVIVQANDVAFADAQLGGVAIQRASGTLAYDKGVLHVYSAQATVADGRVVAAGTFEPVARGAGTIALVGVGLHGAGLHGLGLPLQSGDVAVAGRLGNGGGSMPSFDGGVSVKDGRAQGYPVSGSASLALHGGTLRVTDGVGSLGDAVGLVDGSIGGLSSHAPRYALQADVPAADVATTLRTLHLPGYQTTGVFNADLAIGGSGSSPVVAGPVAVPGGSVNGLPFVDASARLDADRGGLSARYGGALVGTTGVRFSAIARKGENALSVRAPHATLSDFNNFFDTGDTLDGVGAIAFSLLDSGGSISTDGDVDVKGFRYRALPIGDTIANWSSVRNVVNGKLAVSGAHGSLHVAGSMTLAKTDRMDRIVADSRYDATATVDDMDLSTWLPAFGYPELPLLGRVDASARVRGAYPHLHVIGEADLTNGSFGRLPIDALSAAVGSNGDSIVLQNAEVTAPAFAATATGTLGLTKTMPLALTVHAVTDDLPLLVAQLTRKDITVKGSFETTAQIGGTLLAPTFQAAFDASGVDAYGLVASSIFGSVRLTGGNLELRNAGATFTHGEATLAGTLPLQLSPFQVASDRPVNFDLALTGVDPGALDEVLGNGTKLGGRLDGHVNLVGTLHQPRIYGRVSIANGTYTSNLERTPITASVGSVTFDRTSATISGFSAHFGTGIVRGSGSIAFAQGFGRAGDVNYHFDAKASSAQIDLPAYGRGTLDGTLALDRTPPGIAKLSGSLAASDAVIPFSAFVGAQGAKDGGTSLAGLPVDMNLALDVKARKNVRVRGGGLASLDIGGTGEALLGGSLAAPTLSGGFTSTGGTLTYFDRAFRVQSGSVSFDPADGVMPTIHAVGVTHIVNPDPSRARNPYGSADITIKVDGSLAHLAIAFNSNPPGYTNDQILALIAPFGGFIGSGIAFNPITGQPTGPPAPGNLPGAPLANTGQALPGVLVAQSNGTLTIGQEAFNILNAQFASGLIAPIENALSQGLGLDSLSLTVDYYGNVGFDVRRKLGKYVNAVYATTFGIPTRTSVGLEYAPNDSTSAQLSAFFESGATRLIQTPGSFGSSTSRLTAGQALQGSSGFTFTLQRLFW